MMSARNDADDGDSQKLLPNKTNKHTWSNRETWRWTPRTATDGEIPQRKTRIQLKHYKLLLISDLVQWCALHERPTFPTGLDAWWNWREIIVCLIAQTIANQLHCCHCCPWWVWKHISKILTLFALDFFSRAIPRQATATGFPCLARSTF